MTSDAPVRSGKKKLHWQGGRESGREGGGEK